MSVFMRQCELMPNAPLNTIIQRARVAMQAAVSKPLIASYRDAVHAVLQNAAKKVHYGQSLSLVSAYGVVLGSSLPTSAHLSDQAACLEEGKLPLPIYTSAYLDRQVPYYFFPPFFLLFIFFSPA